MLAGRLKYKLELLRPTATEGEFGSGPTTYTAAKTVHAERVNLTGNSSEEVAEIFPNYRAQFRIRDAHEVAEKWRVRQLGGYLYTVTNIIPNLDRGMKTLICDRVNE